MSTAASGQLPKKLLPFIWHFLKKYKFSFFVYLFCVMIMSDVPVVLLRPYLLKLFFGRIGDGTITLTSGFLLLFGIVFSDPMYLINAFKRTFEFKSIKRTIEDMRCTMFKYLTGQTVNFFNTNYSGEIVNKIDLITESTTSVIECFMTITKNIILLLIFNGILFYFGFLFGIVGIVWSVLYSIVSFYYLVVKKTKQSVLVQDSNNKIAALVNDDFMNVKNIKIFSNQKFERRKLKNLLKEKFKRDTARCRYTQIADFYFFVLNFSLVSLALLISLLQLKNGLINVGDFIFLIYAIQMQVGFSREICWLGESLRDIVAMDDSLGLITNDIVIKDKKDAKQLNVGDGKIVSTF